MGQPGFAFRNPVCRCRRRCGQQILRQPCQFTLRPEMSLHHIARDFNDQCLCGMQACKIRFTPGFVRPAVNHAVRLGKTHTGLAEKGGGLWLQRSMPSVRMPSISGVRSL